MAEERGPRPGETSDAAGAVEPGTVSRLLREIALLPADVAEAAWREALQPGAEVGRYRILREIGRGGFGAVYEAFDPELGRVVALKALRPGRTRRTFSEEWIRKEAEAVAKLDHPAIVTIHDVGTCPAGAYLVMELLRGETLARRIEKGPLPVDEALRVAEQMAEGLAHAHSRGVLHRDLKPANVFVCEDGRVKLLDFGLAHLLGTEGSSGAGTPAYMAPEQATGTQVDERADVWAAGMVLGETLTGKRPVERTPTPQSSGPVEVDRTALMWQPESSAKTPVERHRLGGVPRPVAKLVESAVAEDVAVRPKDGAAWLTGLRSARAAVERPRRVRRIAILGGVGVVLGLAVAGVATWRVWERQIPGGRPTVAVADFVNETGDAELDSVGGLLTTSLEQGTQLRVLTRGRMLDVLKQLGKQDVQRIDEPLAREVGREARADALLLASIRRLGNGLVVGMRALDPLHDEYVFTVSERASGKEAVFDIVDRLGSATRAKLGRPSATEAAPRIATITTTDPQAWALFVKSREASAAADWGPARKHAEAALAIDPEFALAHYQLAFIEVWTGTDPSRPPSEVARARLEAAEGRADRLPERERLFLRHWRATLERKLADARDTADMAAARYPLDKEAVYLAGNTRAFGFGDPEGLLLVERALQLDPGYEIARMDLLGGVAAFGVADRHLDRIRPSVASPIRPQELALAAQALLVVGQEAEGLAALERSLASREAASPGALHVRHLLSHGRAPEAEGLLRGAIALHAGEGVQPRNWEHHYSGLADALAAQGRLAEARGVNDEHARLVLARTKKPVPASSRIRRSQLLAVAARSPERVRALAEEHASGEGGDSAPVQAGGVHLLAYAGDVAAAGSLAAALRRDLGPTWSMKCTPMYAWDAAPRRCGALAAFRAARTAGAQRELL
ncbi:MAG TPA: protein kinase, partial [Anaeromyxobacteraceae bacterium]|nr:protein kinase [Anaeromyxobacteraceae bacterium]